jgi:multidrug resistance protein
MPPERSKSALPILFLVIIIDLIGFGIVLPILPFYAKHFGASPVVLGLLLATHAAMQFVFSPRWGRLSDRIGRRPVMLITIAGTSASLVLLGAADSIEMLFIARALSGLFGANISVATAYLADVTEEKERTRWMGMVGASFGVGFLLGPAIGGLLAPYGRGLPMWVAGGIAALNLVWAIAALKEPERHEQTLGRVSIRDALEDRVVARLLLTNFLFCLAVAQLESVFAYFMMDRFDYDERSVAAVLVMMAFIMMMIQGGGMRALAERLGERSMMIGGFLLMALVFPLIPQVSVVGVLLIPLSLSAVGRAIAQPPMSSLVSLRADPQHRGVMMGAFQSSASLARIFGPACAGLLYQVDQANPFYLAGALLLVCFGLALGLPVRDTAAASDIASSA